MNYQPDFNSHTTLKTKKRRLIATSFVITLGILAVYLLIFAGQAFMGSTIEIDNKNPSTWDRVASLFPFGKNREIEDPDYAMPEQEKDRLDILVLGTRGAEDKDGGNLADTIMLFSYDKKTGKSSLVSIPRDIYVKINEEHKDKINSAYSWLGMAGAKKLMSRVTGVYIDNIIVFDFSSFRKIVDTLGGIDIVLDKPFTETQQWGYEFSLPAGNNHLDGEQALYYVRSRYSSSDFDRARRQQQVIFGIKKKITDLNILDDPGRTIDLISTVSSHIKTDMNLFDSKTYINLAKNVNSSNIKRHVVTTLDLLYETHENGSYVLLPQGGNFDRFKYYFRHLLSDPVPTPSATP